MKQAETQQAAADSVVDARLPEAYQWLLCPTQQSLQAPVEWQVFRLSGQDALAVRASKKLKNDELLITSFAASRLRMELDRVPLWRGNHVAIKQLVEDFARYLYLPRLKGPEVLLTAVASGVGLLTWEQDAFAYADGYDDEAGRYQGLQFGKSISRPDPHGTGLLVKPTVAKAQAEAESKPRNPQASVNDGPVGSTPKEPVAPPPQLFNRYHGTVVLDPTRVGRDASRIADEVITHLAGLVGADVKVTLEIQAEIPGGAPDNVVRTVTENGRTLKFTSQGFEKD